MEAGGRQFAETIAFGPGAWEQLPDGLKQGIIFNAPTFLDEQRDSDWLMIDLHALENFACRRAVDPGRLKRTVLPAGVGQGRPSASAGTKTNASRGWPCTAPESSRPIPAGRDLLHKP